MPIKPDVQRVLVVAGDPGGGAALVPVIRELLSSPVFEVRLFAYRQSLDIFRKHGFPVVPLDETSGRGRIREILERAAPDCLLTSASSNGVDLEKLFLDEADNMRIFSVSLVDFWSNYRPRFELPGRLALPTVIAVVDECMEKEMIESGFPADRLRLTGHPAHSALPVRRAAFKEIRADVVRERLGIRDLGVLFISQPVYPDWNSQDFCRLFRGFSKETVLPSLIACLESLAADHDRKITLLIRPHPREARDDFSRFASDKVSVRICRDESVDEVLKAVDVVAGMDSALMVDACLLGCVVISLQPGLNRADVLPTNRWGVSLPVYSADEITAGFKKTLFDSDWRVSCSTRGRSWDMEENATRSIVSLIQQSYLAESIK